jgi:bifunctional UDP-N-acetylglucosamine pyrophosphorylase/glucosamine-1-phosphate N-acetyltransferase
VQLSNPILSAAADPAVDVRLTPGYYFEAAGLGTFVEELLATCRTVFDIKAAMTLVLDAPDAAGLITSERGVVEDGADVDGTVIVQSGARIEAGARVSGPVLVCTGAVIARGAVVRDHSMIGPGCQVGCGAEITRSLLAGGCFMKHASFVGDSVLGRGVNVGAFCSTTGLRCTGPVTEPAMQEITVILDGKRIRTGQTKLGAIVGDGVALPAATVLSPGTLIGPGTVIYPRNQVGGVLPAGSLVR